ncbi:MAG: RNA polymerase subunit sigma [Planctomycetes bacterium]|nr:RNA polymerase subunit sigma [Planctomycetota bacterium]
MTEPSDAEITQLLTRFRDGDADAGERLVPLLYASLRARAESLMRGESREVTLQPTVLVHEAWLRLCRSPGGEWRDRGFFLRLAGRVMRNVLVDRARRKRPAVADGVDPETLAIPIGPGADDHVEVLSLHEALERLAERDPELADLVDMRFFGGVTLEDAAEVLGRSRAAVHRSWELARTILLRELRRGDPESDR